MLYKYWEIVSSKLLSNNNLLELTYNKHNKVKNNHNNLVIKHKLKITIFIKCIGLFIYIKSQL